MHYGWLKLTNMSPMKLNNYNKTIPGMFTKCAVIIFELKVTSQ